MNVTLLSNVRQGVFNYCICVRISRMWEFHGKNDEDEIKHLDLVVIDEKVNYFSFLKLHSLFKAGY
jgi:replication factor A1